MIIKIGDKVYSANDVPIMVVLDENDKRNILSMPPDAFRYACAPDGYFENDDAFLEWIDDLDWVDDEVGTGDAFLEWVDGLDWVHEKGGIGGETETGSE